MAELVEAGNGKPRRRQGAKATGHQAAGKVKATIHISAEADRKLSVHATMLGMDRSELVEELIQKHLRRFIVSDRGGEADASDGQAVA